MNLKQTYRAESFGKWKNFTLITDDGYAGRSGLLSLVDKRFCLKAFRPSSNRMVGMVMLHNTCYTSKFYLFNYYTVMPLTVAFRPI
jgi:hypothetical protein